MIRGCYHGCGNWVVFVSLVGDVWYLIGYWPGNVAKVIAHNYNLKF